MFKANWERASTQHSIPASIIEQMVRLACPNKIMISHHLIADGCANINIKIVFENDKPIILRVYLRDKGAGFREQKIGRLLKGVIPLPQIHHFGEVDGYHFSISDFLPGITLRDLLLGNAPYDVNVIMREAGYILSKIAAFDFPKAGFFDADLNVVESTLSGSYQKLAEECLENPTAMSIFSSMEISYILQILENYCHQLPDEEEKHLVHADFDPSNILVDNRDGTWKVSAILDWEFAFSGSVLCDVANMLRYKHLMSSEFQNSFLKGLMEGGVSLPSNWQSTVLLLNLISLLDCLKRSDPMSSPIRCEDIRQLVHHILGQFEKHSSF
jgi:hypothetical protein